jgi:amidase
MRHFLGIGAAMTEEQYAGASQLRTRYSQAFDAVLGQVDAVVCPAGGLTFELDRELLYGGNEEIEPLFSAIQMYFTIPADFAGTPALTVPCGFSPGNVPYALQFMGRRRSEATLCRLGHAYEQATDWHQRRPPGYA